MVVERISARPINQFDLRIDSGSPVIFESLTRMRQQVGNSSNGNKAFYRITSLGQSRPGNALVISTDRIHRAVTKADAAAWKPKLS